MRPIGDRDGYTPHGSNLVSSHRTVSTVLYLVSPGKESPQFEIGRNLEWSNVHPFPRPGPDEKGASVRVGAPVHSATVAGLEPTTAMGHTSHTANSTRTIRGRGGAECRERSSPACSDSADAFKAAGTEFSLTHTRPLSLGYKVVYPPQNSGGATASWAFPPMLGAGLDGRISSGALRWLPKELGDAVGR